MSRPIPTTGYLSLGGEWIAPEKPRNPCLALYGKGPEGKTCVSCALLEPHSQSRTWYKCKLRKPGGPATDHRVRWPACGRFEVRA